MMRWGRVVIVFLVLGAAVNVGVAWGLTLTGAPNYVRNLTSDETRGLLVSQTLVSSAGYHSVGAWCDRSIGREQVFFREGKPVEPHDDAGDLARRLYSAELKIWAMNPVFLRIDTSGIPSRSMRCWYRESPSGALEIRGGLAFRRRVLPMCPIWPGFLANSAVYAAALWLLLLGSGAVKRSVRRRRGRCVDCGYDLRVE
jgi:hypothetical protein